MLSKIKKIFLSNLFWIIIFLIIVSIIIELSYFFILSKNIEKNALEYKKENIEFDEEKLNDFFDKKSKRDIEFTRDFIIETPNPFFPIVSTSTIEENP